MAGSEIPMGIYKCLSDNSLGALSLKHKSSGGSKMVFMVTMSAQIEKDPLAMWIAKLVPQGDGVWELNGHPRSRYFIALDSADGTELHECEDAAGLKEVKVWTYADESLQGSLFSEPVKPPSDKFPSVNFEAAVTWKDPSKNEEETIADKVVRSPDTQTVVEEYAYQNLTGRVTQKLPQGPIGRQIELVKIYTKETPLYKSMNAALRNDDYETMRYFASYIKELREVFLTDHHYQIINPFEGVVWRGCSVPNPVEAIKDYKPGKDFVWAAFTSTTTNRNKCLPFGNILFEIHCEPPEGTYDDDDWEFAPARISEFSVFPDEEEILFPPNTKFRVRKVAYLIKDGPHKNKVMPSQENPYDRPLIICDATAFDTQTGQVEFEASKAAEEAAKKRAAQKKAGEERLAGKLGELESMVLSLKGASEKKQVEIEYELQYPEEAKKKKKQEQEKQKKAEAEKNQKEMEKENESKRKEQEEQEKKKKAAEVQKQKEKELEENEKKRLKQEIEMKQAIEAKEKEEKKKAEQRKKEQEETERRNRKVGSIFASSNSKDAALLDRVYKPNLFAWSREGGGGVENDATALELRCIARLHARKKKLEGLSLEEMRALKKADVDSMDTFLSSFDAIEANIGSEYGRSWLQHMQGLGSGINMQPSTFIDKVPMRSASLPRPQSAFPAKGPSVLGASVASGTSMLDRLTPQLPPWDRLPPRRIAPDADYALAAWQRMNPQRPWGMRQAIAPPPDLWNRDMVMPPGHAWYDPRYPHYC